MITPQEPRTYEIPADEMADLVRRLSVVLTDDRQAMLTGLNPHDNVHVQITRTETQFRADTLGSALRYFDTFSPLLGNKGPVVLTNHAYNEYGRAQRFLETYEGDRIAMDETHPEIAHQGSPVALDEIFQAD